MKSKREKIFFVVYLVFSLPFIAGWEKVSLNQLISGPAQKEPFAQASVELSPFKILEKATTAFYQIKSMQIEIETWLENPFLHIKTQFNSLVQNIDDAKTDGRISASLLAPGGISTSSWVQTYKIGGVPFQWDLQNRKWLAESLKISSKEAKKDLEFSLLASLVTINEGAVDPSSINILGIEKRSGRDCYVLYYHLFPEFLKRLGLMGNISIKTWIDTKEFFPLMLRAEGKIADMYILQIVQYSNFNASSELTVPSYISETVKKEKEKLNNQASILASAVADIRGWDKIGAINLEFKDRISLRDFLAKQIEQDYTPEEIKREEAILKWLRLLYKDADYKDNMINSGIASIAGLYDPKEDKVYLGNWIPPSFSEAVLVHEIAHVYQDKNFGLDTPKDKGGISKNFDFSFAERTFLEGEATAVMLEYILRKDKKSFRDLDDIFALIEERLLKQGLYVKQDIMYNIYGYGANFIQTCLKDYDWPYLDRMYRLPPVTMQEIIYPFKYQERELFSKGPSLMRTKHVEDNLPLEWKKSFEATLGEFLILLSLKQNLEKESAEKAASGWQNDKLLLYENQQGKKFIFFQTRWNNSGEALEFFQAYKIWLKKNYPKMGLEEDKNKAFLETGLEGIYRLSLENDIVEIIWSEGLNKEAFNSLMEKIYGNTKFKVAQGR